MLIEFQEQQHMNTMLQYSKAIQFNKSIFPKLNNTYFCKTSNYIVTKNDVVEHSYGSQELLV